MRRVVVAVLAAGLLVAPSAPADASGSCATPREFRQVEKGMGLPKVRRVFGGKESGAVQFGDGRSTRYWEKCGKSDLFAVVEFEGGEVVGKRYSS